MKKCLLIAAFAVALSFTRAKADGLAVSFDLLNQVNYLTPSGTMSPFVTGSPGAYPNGLAYDALGNLYVSSYSDNTITKYAPNGTSSLFATLSAPLGSAQGMTFDNAGNLYVAGYNTGNIYMFTPDGTQSTFSTTMPGAWLTDVAFDHNGVLYASDYWNEYVYTIANDGTASIYADLNPFYDPEHFSAEGPGAMAFDSTNALYLSNLGRYVFKITDDGALVDIYKNGYSTAFGVAVDQYDNLYVGDYITAGYINKYSSDGTLVDTTTGLDHPDFMTPTNVPEPSTYALCGFGALMVFLGCRRKLAVARA